MDLDKGTVARRTDWVFSFICAPCQGPRGPPDAASGEGLGHAAKARGGWRQGEEARRWGLTHVDFITLRAPQETSAGGRGCADGLARLSWRPEGFSQLRESTHSAAGCLRGSQYKQISFKTEGHHCLPSLDPAVPGDVPIAGPNASAVLKDVCAGPC